MYQVENLTHLYRARRYWHTPELNQATNKIIAWFGSRSAVPVEFVAEFMCEINHYGLPDGEGWNTFYEPCPVIKTTPMEVIVVSQNMPPDILELFPDFKAGGTFHINKARLQRDGRALHTRHGEYFYIAVPNVAIALCESRELLEAIS